MKNKEEINKLQDAKQEIQDKIDKLENTPEISKWYKSTKYDDYLIHIQSLDNHRAFGYGFNFQGFWFSANYGDAKFIHHSKYKYLIPATDEEVDKALFKEAEKRYKGVNAKCLHGCADYQSKRFKEFYSDYNDGCVRYRLNTSDVGCIFENGKWAEIIEEPKFEIGKWYKASNRYDWLVCCTGTGTVNQRLEGYGLELGDNDWINGIRLCLSMGWVEATDEEVEKAQTTYANKKYKIGDRFKCLDNGEISEITQLKHWINASNDSGTLWCNRVKAKSGSNSLLFKDGVWAEIIKEPKVTVNGYDMEQNAEVISFGCAKFYASDFRGLKEATEVFNLHPACSDLNRKISFITLDSGVEITVKQLKEIVDNIK